MLLCAFFCIAWVGSCAASAAEVRQAENAGYQADFATVYGEVLAVVVKHYPRTRENAVDGVIKTAWHPVAVQTGSGRARGRGGSAVAGTKASTSLTNTVSSDRKRFFIRFDVRVFGGKPWRVRVVGEASEWGGGDVPVPMRGAEIPPWLKGRTDSLRVEIYNRLKKYAVDLAPKAPKAKGPAVAEDEPQRFGDIPEGAQHLLSEVHRTIGVRRFEDLRPSLATDVQWSAGEVGNADVALAMWQADPAILEAMRRVMGRGCVAGDGALSVSCPRAYSQQADYRGYRLIVEKRGERWLVTAFVKGD